MPTRVQQLSLCFALLAFISATSADLASRKSVPSTDDEVFSASHEDPLLIRSISTGRVRGRKIVTERGVSGYTFLAVPVAEPPVGELRFKRPVARKPWHGVLNATENRVACHWDTVHSSYRAADFPMHEDCLVVNVFTNRHCLQQGGCAVTVYLHGGGFEYGSALQVRDDILVENFNNVSRNVVFVTLNFRQGLFAVMNLNWKLNLSADMNCGFHDIIHAFKWVKNEIGSFGGDPDRVTAMGHSGGGLLVKFLTYSPLSKYLFNQVIVMSAMTLEVVQDSNQISSRTTAKVLGCAPFAIDDPRWEDATQVEMVISCLRNLSAIDVRNAQITIGPDLIFRGLAIDSGPNAAMPTTQEVLSENTLPYPVLAGTTSKEFVKSWDVVTKDGGIDESKLSYWCTLCLQQFGWPMANRDLVEMCEQEYGTPQRGRYIYDDPYLYIPMLNFVSKQSRTGSPLYLYEYIYPNVSQAYDQGPKYPPIPTEMSPKHAQELVYLTGQHLGPMTEKDREIQFVFSQIFVDFINRGSPATPERHWRPFNIDATNYYVINFPDPDMKSPGEAFNYHTDADWFWNDLLPSVAGPRFIPVSETQQPPRIESSEWVGNASIPDLHPSNPLFGQSKLNDHNGLNWSIMFWIGVGIIVLLAISHAITCVKLQSSKKCEYNYI